MDKSYNFVKKTELEPYHKVTPTMPEEYPFWVSAYGFTDHTREITREITVNTAVTRIQCIISGKQVVNSKNISCIASAGDTYILHEGDMHHYYSDAEQPAKTLWFHVKGKLSKEILKIYHLDDIILLKNVDASDWILKMHELCDSTEDPYVIQSEGAALFLKFIMSISKEHIKNQKNISLLDDVKSYIDLHIQDKITIEELAKMSNASNDYTIRKFKNEFGLTPHQYILRGKMRLAQTFLHSTNKSIDEIAGTLGFCNSGYFSNVFLKETGFRPSEYRRRIRTKQIVRVARLSKE